MTRTELLGVRTSRGHLRCLPAVVWRPHLRGADLAKVARAAGEADAAETKMLLRVFCHAHGDKLILLVGGHDKGEDASARRQDREIAVARKRLKDWQKRHRRKPG